MRIFLFSLFLLPALAQANLPLPRPGIDLKTGIGGPASGTDDYRLGDEWGKKAVTADMLSRATDAFKRAAMATARAGGATGFYLGKFNGAHLMASNHHVFPSSCSGQTLSFPLLGISVVCDKFLGSWDEIDLSLFTVRVKAADESKLAGIGRNFQFRDDIKAGQALITIGFGIAGNSGRQLMANQDSDCYVFSRDGEYRLMGDPDQWNPGNYRAWSFALGCDVSHGDSGSAIVDRMSGNVVGIIWTGRIPKSAAAQSSQNLKSMFQAHDEMIWQELSYAVPAKKMGEFLGRLAEGNIPEDDRAILKAMLQ